MIATGMPGCMPQSDHDLGPEGGVNGGEIVAAGTPEAVAANPRSFTGAYLKDTLAKAPRSAASPARPERRRGARKRAVAESEVEEPDLLAAK